MVEIFLPDFVFRHICPDMLLVIAFSCVVVYVRLKYWHWLLSMVGKESEELTNDFSPFFLVTTF